MPYMTLNERMLRCFIFTIINDQEFWKQNQDDTQFQRYAKLAGFNIERNV